MKYLKFTTPILFTMLTPLISFADDDNNDENYLNDDENNIELANNLSNPIGRPKVPSRQRIDCHYTNGMLYIQFAVSEGKCQVTVVNLENGDSQIYYIDSSMGAFLNIGKMTSFELYIETEKGNSYYGSKNK